MNQGWGGRRYGFSQILTEALIYKMSNFIFFDINYLSTWICIIVLLINIEGLTPNTYIRVTPWSCP